MDRTRRGLSLAPETSSPLRGATRQIGLALALTIAVGATAPQPARAQFLDTRRPDVVVDLSVLDRLDSRRAPAPRAAPRPAVAHRPLAATKPATSRSAGPAQKVADVVTSPSELRSHLLALPPLPPRGGAQADRAAAPREALAEAPPAAPPAPAEPKRAAPPRPAPAPRASTSTSRVEAPRPAARPAAVVPEAPPPPPRLAQTPPPSRPAPAPSRPQVAEATPPAPAPARAPAPAVATTPASPPPAPPAAAPPFAMEALTPAGPARATLPAPTPPTPPAPPAAVPAPEPPPPPPVLADRTAPAPASRPAPPAATPPGPQVATAPATGVPSASNRLRLLFDGSSSDLSDSGRAELTTLAQTLTKQTGTRIQLLAYAEGTPTTLSQARRLSLDRALAVRSFLASQGVNTTRIDVRALGNQATDGAPANRVDLVVMAE